MVYIKTITVYITRSISADDVICKSMLIHNHLQLRGLPDIKISQFRQFFEVISASKPRQIYKLFTEVPVMITVL